MQINTADVPMKSRHVPEIKFGAETEIRALNANIEKQEDEISQLNQEFADHIAKGEKDMAQLKSVSIQQKRMEIQAMQLQIERMQQANSHEQDAMGSLPEDAAATKPEQPAAVAEYSHYMRNLLSRQEGSM